MSQDDIIDRLRIAARALVRERKVYAEDVETLADVLRVLEAHLAAAPSPQVSPASGVELTDDVINGLANMCEAANTAHPVRSFIISANDLFPVAVFIHSLHKAAKAAEPQEPAA